MTYKVELIKPPTGPINSSQIDTPENRRHELLCSSSEKLQFPPSPVDAISEKQYLIGNQLSRTFSFQSKECIM
jgi:hypothetical protein